MITIKETTGTNSDGAGTYEIEVSKDGKKVAGFSAWPLYECPEDATLERDMGFAYDAIEFFKLGYEAGKNGEEIVFKEVEE